MNYIHLLIPLFVIFAAYLIGPYKHYDRLLGTSKMASRGKMLDFLLIVNIGLLVIADIHIWWLTLILAILAVILSITSAIRAEYYHYINNRTSNIDEAMRKIFEAMQKEERE